MKSFKYFIKNCGYELTSKQETGFLDFMSAESDREDVLCEDDMYVLLDVYLERLESK